MIDVWHAIEGVLMRADRDDPDPLPGYIPGWGLPTWQDEFNGPTIDTTKWRVNSRSTYGNLSYDWGVITAENCFIRDGQLVQQTKLLSTPVVDGAKTRYWSTPHMDTIGKWGSRYGRIEYRGKLPTTPGKSKAIWPAVWMRNGNLGEIDIMEAWGDPAGRSGQNVGCSSFTIHEKTTGGGTNKGWTIEKEAQKADGIARPHSALGFHTWALEFTPTYFKYYFDGVLCITMTKADYPWAFGPEFATDNHLRINVQMGDPYWTPDPVPSALTETTSEFIIDYVRFWEYKGA